MRSKPVFAFFSVVMACSGSGDSEVGPTDDALVDSSSGDGVGDTLATADGDAVPDTTTPVDGDAGPPPPKTTCVAPITAVDTSKPTKVVGTGTAASCTEAALAAAVAGGGIITFDCGGAATIAISKQIELPTDKDTTLDGGSVITLDGGGKTRILDFNHLDFRKNKVVVTLQHITLAHGQAIGTTKFDPAPAPCSQGFKDGSGGAIYLRDGILHVLDATFVDDHAATPGPDVGGGAIYAAGSLGVVVVSSRFTGCSGSNGGAIGMLNSDLTLVDDTLSGNEATGTGANYIDATCPLVDGQREAGSGGNGGAVSIDGGSDGTVTLCGCAFRKNKGGALGTIFRTPDGPREKTLIDQCTFDGNQMQRGGAAYFHHSDLTITATTFSNNTAEGSGAIQADDTVLDMTNVTFSGNSATKGLGGAISLFGNGGTFLNCTFADNHADFGSGYFGAALAGGTKFTIGNTLFVNNTSKDAGAGMTCAGTSDGANDLQWPKNHLVGGAPDTACVTGITFADATLSPLADNGGPTWTMAPKPGSPAIGLGKACPKTDQRGHARKADGCTAGAYEVD
jgi:hypothetical protein